jgi:hypothetical protein
MLLSMTSFLLRFQEKCSDEPLAEIRCGTATATNVEAEGGDNDPSGVAARSRVLPMRSTRTRIASEESDEQSFVGATHTLVAQEGTDETWSMRAGSVRVLPIATQTKSITAVNAEQTDQDPAETKSRVIPVAAAQTKTAVKVEQSDDSFFSGYHRVFSAPDQSTLASVA